MLKINRQCPSGYILKDSERLALTNNLFHGYIISEPIFAKDVQCIDIDTCQCQFSMSNLSAIFVG